MPARVQVKWTSMEISTRREDDAPDFHKGPSWFAMNRLMRVENAGADRVHGGKAEVLLIP